MSQFSRSARWLRDLFPASVAPLTQDPTIRSDDVSLTADYAGGGWPLPSDPHDWTAFADSTVGITGDADIITAEEDEIIRIFSYHVFTLLAPPATCSVSIGTLTPPLEFVKIANEMNSPAFGVGALAWGEEGNNRSMILGPGLTLRFNHRAGGGGSQMRYGVYFCRAPLGTVFHC